MSYKCIQKILLHTYVIKVLPDGTFASITNKTIKIWKLNYDMIWECVQILNEHTSQIHCLLILPDSTFASCSTDTTIKIWKQNNGMVWKCIQTLIEHTDLVKCLTVLNDGTFVSCARNNTIKIWKQNDDMTWECAQTIIQYTFCQTYLTILPDDTFCLHNKIFSTPYSIKRIKSKIIFNNVINALS